VLRVGKEQKQKLAATRKGSAVQKCPTYDGYFRVVRAWTEEPAKGVKYKIRRPNGAVIQGETDENGFTQVVVTKRPEVLTLEIVEDPEQG
jgi:hypothetical protein